MPQDERPMTTEPTPRSALATFGCPLFIIGFIVLLILVALLLF